jgi:hypothetical protein
LLIFDEQQSLYENDILFGIGSPLRSILHSGLVQDRCSDLPRTKRQSLLLFTKQVRGLYLYPIFGALRIAIGVRPVRRTRLFNSVHNLITTQPFISIENITLTDEGHEVMARASRVDSYKETTVGSAKGSTAHTRFLVFVTLRYTMKTVRVPKS